MRLLYVEDSGTLRDTVARGLRKAGFAVDTAADGNAGLERAAQGGYAVVILDLMLPGRSGLEVLAEMRKAGVDAEALILTAKGASAERGARLEIVSEDCLAKPFTFDELLVRVRALLRRHCTRRHERIEVGALTVDTRAGRASIAGAALDLPRREYAMLEYLARRSGEVVSRFDIGDHVYDCASALRSNAIAAGISILRKHLRAAGAPDLIRTVPRRGYVLADAKISAAQ